MFKRTIAAAALLSAFSAFAADNLVTCGGFDCMSMPVGDYGTFSGTDFYGWTVTSGPGIELRNHVVGQPQAGEYFVELDSDSNSSMAQTINTVAGQTYLLTFYASSRPVDTTYNYALDPVNGIAPGSTNGLTATFGTAPAIIVATPTNYTTSNQWTLYSEKFTATGASTVLAFAATGPSDSYGTSLDSVSVTAVPEPTTLAMMGAGVLALVGMRRRAAAK